MGRIEQGGQLTELEEMTLAAQHVLDKGWYLFGCVYASKSPYKRSHGHLDALNRTSPDALRPWTHPTDPTKPRNPAVNLQRSNLVAVDVDFGFEGLTDEEVILKGESIGLPRTYTVRSGGAKEGAHFIYAGSRTLPDKTGKDGWEISGLSGDIKHHGFVLAAGAIHDKTLRRYRSIGADTPAPLPTFWREYSLSKRMPLPKDESRISPFELDNLKRDKSKYTPEEWALLVKQFPILDKESKVRRIKDRITIAYDQMIPVKFRQQYLRKQLQRMRALSLPLAMIRATLNIICVQQCVDGLNYATRRREYLDQMVFGYGKTLRAGDIDVRRPPRATSRVGSRVIRRNLGKIEVLVEILRTIPHVPAGGLSSKQIKKYVQNVLKSYGHSPADRMALSRAAVIVGFVVRGQRWFTGDGGSL
jgi:Bifunctional DNA primase/polymerase, N-terminal